MCLAQFLCSASGRGGKKAQARELSSGLARARLARLGLNAKRPSLLFSSFLKQAKPELAREPLDLAREPRPSYIYMDDFIL
jgi:hypothetical protein